MEFSKKESNRFSKNIYRLSTEYIKPSFLKKQLIENNVDILILRLPSVNKDTHFSFSKIGFPIIHADTLVYYLVDLESILVNQTRNNVTLELISDHNKNEIKALIPIIFNDYKNHYFSNPYLNSNDINDGYIEWAESYINAINKISWLVLKNGETVGFATCSYDNEKNECEGVLYGVLPNFAGGGIYSDIIRLTQSYFKNNGYKRMWVSTQIQNYAVQKVWLREGFFLKKSFETYHINSMLNYSSGKPKSFTFSVNEITIESFKDFSGDNNRLHFDNQFAQSLGFEGKISHGMIFQSYLSKYFGVDYPGEGTIFLENKNVFFAPVYPDNEYKVIINTISIDSNGIFEILAKVVSNDDNLCLLSYNTLLNKKFKK